MRDFPAPPDVPSDQVATGEAVLRYEDLCQDGRVILAGLPHAYGEVVFRKLLARDDFAAKARAIGVLPILSRLVLFGTGEPISVVPTVQVDGRFALAHAPGPGGDIDRIFLNLWADVRSARDRIVGAPPAGRGEDVVAGRVFAEHVFTRLFAPPAERRVKSLAELGLPPVPPDRYTPDAPDALLALPAGARWIEDEATPDEAVTVFSLSHTDSNQHVNSLVYPNLVDEAVARRLHRLGQRTDRLATRLELCFRKPFFAGERARVTLRLFEHGDAIGAACAITADGATGGRAHTYAQGYFQR